MEETRQEQTGDAIQQFHNSIGKYALADLLGTQGVPGELLMKLCEEMGEAQKAMGKCANRFSSGHGNLSKVTEELGHVLYFIMIADNFMGGEVIEAAQARQDRHALDPKGDSKLLGD